MRTLTNFFLANLACADLCVGIFCVYQNLSLYLMASWNLGDFMCRMYHFVNSLSYAASIVMLVLISVERFLAIYHPIWYKTVSINTLQIVIILSIYIRLVLCIYLYVYLFVCLSVCVCVYPLCIPTVFYLSGRNSGSSIMSIRDGY